MKITNSTMGDIPEIFRLYKCATDYQKVAFPGNVWPEFDQEIVKNEVLEKRQFKLMIENEIACVWVVTYSDSQIWEESDKDKAIYIHRIATNPNFRGKEFVKQIVVWAKDYATKNNKEYIRLDTCGDNKRLIQYYEKSGFNFLGMKKIKHFSELPAHYKSADVCYFEIKV